MINFPTCKINLGLHILSKRSDGYHAIETAMLEVPFQDVLELTTAETDTFVTGGLPIPGEGNLCLDALYLLREHVFVPPVSIQLLKHIPMGGGLGGGSSDAAFLLKALGERFAPDFTADQLEILAGQLGSDCPFFIRGGFQLCTGRGEILQPISCPVPACWLVLINVGIHVSTQAAYAGVKPQSDRTPLPEILALPVNEWRSHLVNDFEASVFAAHPVLARVKDELYQNGAFYAAMSGSGSTLFGLFAQRPLTLSLSAETVFEHWVAYP